jgi:hypothetical protein
VIIVAKKLKIKNLDAMTSPDFLNHLRTRLDGDKAIVMVTGIVVNLQVTYRMLSRELGVQVGVAKE